MIFDLGGDECFFIFFGIGLGEFSRIPEVALNFVITFDEEVEDQLVSEESHFSFLSFIGNDFWGLSFIF